MSRRLSVVGTDLEATQRLGSERRSEASAVAARIATLVQKVPAGWPIGLERSLCDKSLPHVSAGTAAGYLKRCGIKFVDPQRSKIPDRPASEYGVISLFERMDEGPLLPEDLLTAVKLMGGNAKWCDATVTTHPFPSGHYTEFFPPQLGRVALTKVIATVTEPGLPEDSLIRATRVYFAATLFHALQNGNGRAGRALFQCVLKADLGMRAPLFPLGPLFERNRESLLDAKHCWQWEGDAGPLVSLVCNGVDAYCSLYEQELESAS